MKTKYFRITGSGKIVQTSERMSAHLSAESLTEAKAKVNQFARRALNETPKVKLDSGAVQIAYWSIDGVAVQAGYGDRPDLCLGGVPDMQSVKPESASFLYYAGLARETVTAR
jgi:hypothetical protein